VHSAAASLETVERALGDLRVNGGGTNTMHPSRGGGGRCGHVGGGGPRGGRGNEIEHINVPATDFDFESSNAKFEKTARSPITPKDNATNGDASGNSSEGPEGEKEFGLAYNKSTSFFDSLSSSADAPAPGAGGGHNGGGRGKRGGGGGIGRNRREEERERNVATFGEPGGVGLLGPGGYVGGWGGYGRRGGRPRRGGGRGGHPVSAQG
jgi:protein LSM14